MVYNYLLNSFQRIIYTHRCDIWRKAIASESDWTVGDDNYLLIYEFVPCRYVYTPNVDDPTTAIGTAKRMTTLTTDIISLPIFYIDATSARRPVALPDGCVFVNQTSNEFAQLNRKQMHTGLGSPQIEPGINNQINRQTIMAMAEEHPIQAISDYYRGLPGAEK